MKSKKSKNTNNDPTTNDPPRSHTFNLFKNRFFQNTNNFQRPVDEKTPIYMQPTEKPMSFGLQPDMFKHQRPMSLINMDTWVQSDLSKTKAEKRTSLIVIKEGYLLKKTDFKPFHRQTKLERGWKLYKVVLRGHKLYFFKVLTESPLRSLFPTSSQVSKTSLKLVLSDFDREAQKALSHHPEGLTFIELHPINMQSKRQVQLILDNGYLFLCHRERQLWKIEQKVSIQQLKITPIDVPDACVFSVLYTNNTTLGIYSTQYLHAGQAWIQAFQNNTQSEPHFLIEDTLERPLIHSARTCDGTQRHHVDLLWKSNTIVGGTVEALVHELIHTNDKEYVHAFLLNHSTFTTGSYVLNEIKLLLGGKLNKHVLELFTIWCESFALDIVGDVASGMISILGDTDTLDTEKVKGIVLGTVAENAKLIACDQSKFSSALHNPDNQEEETETADIENILSVDGGSVNLSNLLITGLVPTVFLKIASHSFAENVYLFHVSQHTKHRQALMNPASYLPRPQTSIEMLNSLLFTTASPHFLTRLIRTHVLMDSQQQGGVSLRTQLLTHWIHVGIRLYELGDTTGWCAVTMGLCSVGIIRLRESWKAVDRQLVQTVQSHWARILTDHGLFEQNIWAETWDQEKHLKFASLLYLGPQSLPFFGTIRQAVDRQRRRPKETGDMVDFNECERIYRTIKHSLQDTREPHIKNESLRAVGSLQSFFEHSVTDLISLPHDLKYLHESSLACEPKVFGQVHTLIAESTSVPFSPAVLENCTLLNKDGSLSFSLGSTDKNIRSTVRSTEQVRHTDKRGSRRRTLSFPPGANPILSESHNRNEILESINSRTWLGSLASGRQHSTYTSRALMEAHGKSCATQSSNGDIDLTVAQGELVFKVVALLRSNERDGQCLKRTESIHSVQFLKQEEERCPSELLVAVKEGNFECLVECLICGIYPYQEMLKEQWQMLYLTERLQYQADRVIMDEENYINVFFTSFRSSRSPSHLLNILQKDFLGAKLKYKLKSKKKGSRILLETYFSEGDPKGSPVDSEEDEIDTYDWEKIASVQLRILNLVLYWLEEHPYDFMDEPEFIRYTIAFLKNAAQSLASWCAPLRLYLSNTSQEDPAHKGLTAALNRGNKVQLKINTLESKFIQNSISPCYDTKSIPFDTECLFNAQTLYQKIMNGSQLYTCTLQLVTNKIPLSVSHKPVEADAASLVDRYSPEVLLEQLDKSVCQLFESVTIQDWMQAFDVLELQCSDPCAWLPPRKPSRAARIFEAFTTVLDAPSTFVADHRVLSEEVIISDIFTAIQGAKRPALISSSSDDDLLIALSGSIQYLYCMHFIIRSWAIQQMTSLEIDSKTRLMRVDKFLQMVLVSKTCSQKMALFPELQVTKGRAPGFVENAISSALMSPEVRLFTRTWNDISVQYGHAPLDSLEGLLKKMTPPVLAPDTVTPSLGWIFERVMEICSLIPDRVEKKLIHFDKQRYLYHFLQILIHAQIDLHKRNKETKGFNMSFLITPNLSRKTWRDLKDYASRENKTSLSLVSSSKNLRPSSSRSLVTRPLFNKIIAKQMEKLKRDFKERDRVDKDWLVLQHKLQKRQLEQFKISERQERPHSMMPRINSFFKGLRPPSLISTNIFPNNLTSANPSTVINLIHSTTSVASTYTKRDFVFRIVTEEGGQYLLQGTNREDMVDWMRQINEAAREGAVKRQSVLAAESTERRKSALVVETRQPLSAYYRKSVYGVHVDHLMRDGKIPVIVEKCITEIERRGLEEVGIYRVAGTGSVVSMLKAEFNKDVHRVNLADSKWADVNVVADALKHFLRELPEPLLTHTYYDEFIKASASEDHDQRVYLIKEVIHKLPYNNYALLKRIIEHFVNVTDFEGINHMYATNLAIVFGPTLLQPAPGPASFATTMSNLGHHQNIVKYLILNYHYLFDVENEEVETKDEQALTVE